MSAGPLPTASEVVAFWRDAGYAKWFRGGEAFDREVRERLEAAHFAAARRELDGWMDDAEGALALLILLDQAPRNLFRGSAHAYATDPLALHHAERMLEAGFDQVAPNRPVLISSWAYDQAVESGIPGLTDNRAVDVPCYHPGYTLVEKLQTISTKYRKQDAGGAMPRNFLRHYYDVYCLLAADEVLGFIGSEEYYAHKGRRFPASDDPDISRNPAFLMGDEKVRARFEESYAQTRALYYREQPGLDLILARIAEHSARL